MTTLAEKTRSPQTSTHEAAPALGCRLVVCWPCTRRSADPGAASRLERIACILAVQPIDAHHAAIECWIESQGMRQRTILQPTTRPYALHADVSLLHIDVASTDGSRLLALSIDRPRQRIVYAQTTLVRDAGLGGGTYDPPLLLPAAEARIAQSA